MNVSTSLGIYDFLNYLVIGVIISLVFVPCIPQNAGHLFVWGVVCLVAGLVFHKAIEDSIGKQTRNNPDLIKLAFEDKANYSDIKLDKPILMEKEYYRAYYYLQEKGQLNNIPELEAISSFFQDLFLVVLLYLVISVGKSFILICTRVCEGSLHDCTSCVMTYGILCTFAILVIVFIIYCVPWRKLGKEYSNFAKITFYIICILLFAVAATAGACYFGFCTLNGQECPCKECLQCWQSFITTIQQAKCLIMLPPKFSIPFQLAAILLLPLLLFLRYFTEMKIFKLVWEGYIFLNYNKQNKNQIKI